MLNQSRSTLDSEQLEKFIIAVVDSRLESHKNRKLTPNKEELREIFKSIDQHIWIPPVNAPSTLEMLQSERNK
jgi:hypothetical protein